MSFRVCFNSTTGGIVGEQNRIKSLMLMLNNSICVVGWEQ